MSATFDYEDPRQWFGHCIQCGYQLSIHDAGLFMEVSIKHPEGVVCSGCKWRSRLPDESKDKHIPVYCPR